jgi:hypothetical protein
MRMSIVMMQNNSICQHSSALTVNIGFQLLFIHSTIPCTINSLSMILEMLVDETIKISKQHQHHIAGRKHTFEFLGPGQ